MKKGRFWISMFASGVFALVLVAQGSRFADLRSQAKALERQQAATLAEIKKLEAEIALLSRRERTDALASRMGLKRVMPEDTLRILVDPQARQLEGSARAKSGVTHD